MKKNLAIRFRILAVVAITMILGGLGLSLRVFADPYPTGGGASDTTDGGIHGGGCGTSKYSVDWDTCYGGTWYEYDATSDLISIPKAGNVDGGTLKNCLALGATKYYRLGLIIYGTSSKQPTNYGSYGIQAGLTPVSWYKPSVGQVGGTGNTTYYKIPGDDRSLYWNDAMDKFNIAKQVAKDRGYDLDNWQSVSGFCWNDEWGEDTDDPDPTPPNSAQGWTADVEVTVLGRDGVEDHTIRSEKDMQAVIAVSADNAFQVRFKHTMYFTPSPGPWLEGHDGKQVEPSCTNWNVTTDNGPSASGTLCADSVSGIPPTVIYDQTITVTPGNNTRNWAASVNNYGPKSYTYPLNMIRDKHVRSCGEWGCSYYWDDQLAVYSAIGSGSGSAAGAVSAVKPKDPEGSVQVGTGLPYIFVGQDTTAAWNVTGTGWHERRIMSTQSPIYQVNAAAARSGKIADVKDREYNYDPCGYWRATQPGVISCQNPVGNNPYEDAQVKAGIPTITAQPAAHNFQVPDNTGDKFCTTYGYNWKYYWAYGTNFGVGSRPTEDAFSNWAQEGGGKSRYWFIFGSSCRTMVKKPTTALWNGGLLTNGGVNASIAWRHNNATFGATANGDRKNYSSWTEYLGVIGKGVNNFGTGGSYARGTTGDTNPLTIANRGTLGGSGISTSNTYRTRLNTYIRPLGGSNLADMYNTNNQGTKVTILSGNQTISRNIEINGTYDSIYQLPQNVIFVDGNLNIDPSVTRIDAWLIVTGELNTCPSFASGSTETAPGGNTACDKQLIFNGPVIAETLRLNRSYGADPILQGAKYTPAEVFNLSADSYLWAYAQAGRYGSSYTESYSRELAPRY